MGIKNKCVAIYSQYKNHGLKSVLNKFEGTLISIACMFGATLMFYMIQYSSEQLPLMGVHDMFKDNGVIESFLKVYFLLMFFLNMVKDFSCFKEEKIVSLEELVSYLKSIKNSKQQNGAIWKAAEYITNDKNHHLTKSNFDIIISNNFESAMLEPKNKDNKSFYYKMMKILNEKVCEPRSFIYVKDGNEWKVKHKAVEHVQ